MARDLFAAAASTVASESAFSTSGRVISDYRSRLTSKNVEALICLQDWLRAEGNLLLTVFITCLIKTANSKIYVQDCSPLRLISGHTNFKIAEDDISDDEGQLD